MMGGEEFITENHTQGIQQYEICKYFISNTEFQ